MSRSTLIITSEFPPQPGGIGNHALHLSLQLQKKGYDVTVVTNQRDADFHKDLEFDASLKVEVVRIKKYRPSFRTYLMRVKTILSLIRKKEVVFASGKFSLWIVAFASLFFDSKKYIAVLHGSDLGAGGKWGVRMTKWSLKRFDKLIAVSNFTKELALKGCPDIKVNVINNGFSPIAESSVQYAKEDYLSIITVGSVTARKGQQNVIKALPLLKKHFPNLVYHIVGLPKEKAKFLKLAEDLNVASSVIFHGAVSDEELYQMLTASKVFFMLSDHLSNGDVEGFGIAVLEANNAFLPAIGSKNSGIADAIKDGFSGKLVNPHDSDEILSALLEIISNYDAYAQQAKEWSKKFHWEHIIKQYLKEIEQ